MYARVHVLHSSLVVLPADVDTHGSCVLALRIVIPGTRAHRALSVSHTNGPLAFLHLQPSPPKRRRTLAGSIISTALSAALIGTAVGLTVYRLWRDRGKHPEALPPPPYEQGAWVPPEPEPTPAPETPKLVLAAPTTPRSRKSRHVAGRRTLPRPRKTHSRAQSSLSHSSVHSSYASRAPIPPEFNFPSGSRSSPKPEEDADVDEKMTWIGDRLAQLIAEGQKALGREVVIMSEDKEDEVDDGSGAWVEDDDDEPVPGSSIGFTRGVSVESDTRSVFGNVAEDDSAWGTSEMRESMERARVLYRQKRAL
ncbi:hypothetical protein BD414DRAFT_541449 [Trametes punicea]|nr:hypothetical protein BD414DRAFT_541491 [Trametes punicea]KAI8968117.1 hypothetical protein BD414DRAFT_541449 [Trametes punicea]